MNKKYGLSVFTALVVGFGSMQSALADGWKFGAQLAYASGISDVVDRYEDNLLEEGFISVDVTEFPVGIGFKSRYQSSSGFSVGLDVGPFFIITGDADHFELPLVGSVGYNFFSGSAASPYIRAGAAYHIASGDYVESRSPGLYAAAGIEFGQDNFTTWGIQVAIDDSELELEIIENGSVDRTEDVNSYDTIISLFILF